jgi:hypothetical protein
MSVSSLLTWINLIMIITVYGIVLVMIAKKQFRFRRKIVKPTIPKWDE